MVAKSKTKLQITKEYKIMTAMKQRKYRKRKQTKQKYLQTLCDLKVERKVEQKKVTMADKTERKQR